MACGSPVSASGSGLEVLGEPVGGALPSIGRGSGVERRAIVGVKAAAGARVDNDLDIRVVLFHEISHLAGIGRRWARVLLAAESEERDLAVLGHADAAERRGLIG